MGGYGLGSPGSRLVSASCVQGNEINLWRSKKSGVSVDYFSNY
jgi:hypothetical protein